MTSKDDIVRRLRNPDPLDGLYSLCRSAAAEIEALRSRPLTFKEWMDAGIDNKWAIPFCAEHGPIPTTSEEDALFDEYDDPCMPSLRVITPEGAYADE